jgi:hypothetical protein
MLEELQLPNIFYVSSNGIIKKLDIEIPISGISAYLSERGEIILEGFMAARHNINNFDVIFEDKNGWKISGKNFSIFNESVTINAGQAAGSLNAAFKAKGLRLIAERGKILNEDDVNIYNIITDIEFSSEIKIKEFKERGIKFTPNELESLLLIKSNITQVPRGVGYFCVADKFGNFDNKWKNYLDVLLSILRFAASSFINSPVIYINNLKGGEHIEVTPYMEYDSCGSSIFYLGYPGTISDLINSTFKQFVTMRQILDLDKLLMYYIMMKNTRFVDNAYLLGCVFMEGLKYSFAKNLKNISYDASTHKFIKSDGKTKYSFKELIDELYHEYDITHGSTNFIRFRNEVIHEGAISSIPFIDILSQKQDLEITIEHLLLNILNYKGLYWDKPSRQWVEYRSIVT